MSKDEQNNTHTSIYIVLTITDNTEMIMIITLYIS